MTCSSVLGLSELPSLIASCARTASEGSTRTDDGEDVAWDAIRIKLQEIIDKEDKKNPLSDDEIMASLQRDGLNVARRTITKYRKKMGIPSSRQRRDWTKRTATKDPD